jgi:capsular exopolysaccharide synthesis family protein
MSRIDEALKRASAGLSNGPAVISAEPVAPAREPFALHRYADEELPEVSYLPEQPVTKAASARETFRTAPAAPTLAPPPRSERVSPSGKTQGDNRIVTSPETGPVVVEQYRRLASALLAVQGVRELKTLMVSSAVPNEGKTLTVTNLALTLSESYSRRVLLIDADLRRPNIHELFGLQNTVGLGNALRSGPARLEPYQVSPTLSVLPAGSGGNPVSELSSERMRTLLAELASRYDWVLLDTPPVGLLSDAHLVARVTDAVLFVIAAGKTPYHLVQRSIREVGIERIVGTVLNRVDASKLATDSYYDLNYYQRRQS